MIREWKIFVGTMLSGLLLSHPVISLGQQKQNPPDRTVVERDRVFQSIAEPGFPPPPPPGDTFVFVSSELSFDGQQVKGAPYSAQAVTESTQTLSDGNRIVNKSTSSVYRDSEGRSRREQTLRAFGPFAAGGDVPQTVFISDPVAGVSYTLDPRAHVARRMPAFHFEFRTAEPGKPQGGEVSGVIRERKPLPPEGPPGDDVFTLRAPVAPGGGAQVMFKREGGHDDRAVTEQLGTQIVEGVAAEGTRTTITIPAGEIGNERAIEIVSERWFSPELKTVVMTRHSDPRFGETVYRLTNISRDEPVHSLFEVPGDYTMKEDPAPMRMKKPAPPLE
ncbi:MAG TPA: hypothetical protein VIV66_05150 [Pyrinomonadaceae bacterium]